MTYLWEREQQEWAAEMIEWLGLAYTQVEGARAAGMRELDTVTLAVFAEEYQRIVAAPGDETNGGIKRGRVAQGKARNLLSRLTRYEAETCAFLYDFDLPFDNNQAERDLRMLKVQQKISGGLGSTEGAQCFARIRGYLATLRKQGEPMLAAIANVFQGHPTVPSLLA